MAALLVGLLIVALGAGGTWFALFGSNPASNDASGPTRLIQRSAVGRPRRGYRRDTRSATAETVRVIHDPGAVRTSPARRIGSAIVLALVVLGIALSIGAVTSAVIVIVVTVVA